jgi:hypothetical protein
MQFSSKFSLPVIMLFSLAIFISSCSDSLAETSEVTELEEEVMYIHDDVMPKMSDIMKHKEKINELLTDSTWHESNPEYVINLRNTLDKLNEAEKEMWDWMHNYSDVFGQLQTDQQKSEFLLQEKEKISEVRVLMLESIDQAENELSKTPL